MMQKDNSDVMLHFFLTIAILVLMWFSYQDGKRIEQLENVVRSMQMATD